MPYPKRIDKTKEELLNEGYKLIDSTFEGEKLEKWYIKYENDEITIYNYDTKLSSNGYKEQYEKNPKGLLIKREPFHTFNHNCKQTKVKIDRLVKTYFPELFEETNEEYRILTHFKGQQLNRPIKIYNTGKIFYVKKQQKSVNRNSLLIKTIEIEESVKYTPNKGGYYNINLDVNNNWKTGSIQCNQHRLVMYAFYYRDDYENLQVDHINRDRTDNRLENLRWVTHMENQLNRCLESKIEEKKICMKESLINEKHYTSNTSGHKYIVYHKRDKLWKYQQVYCGKLMFKLNKSKILMICYKFITQLRILAGHYGDKKNKLYYKYREVIKGDSITFKSDTEEDINNIKLKIKELRNNNPEITGQEIREIFKIKKRKRPKNKLYDSPDIENVEKKDLDNYNKYTFYSNGKIWSKSSGKFLDCNPNRKNKQGYINSVFTSDSGNKWTTSNHRIIALCFIPNPENKPYVDHINGVRHDNRIENLRWVTPKENANNKH